ncbi:MAG: tRNA 4-thiouridine(8) synthase ThiI [Oscillospiraceae bacterium]|nr:tRNA 4-thiouridine(8) synthase ThiI [Oscillospiraceae bacterium]
MEIILGKYGELALKGLNKNQFENSMVRTIRKRVERCGEFNVYTAQSTVYVEPENDDADIDAAYEQIRRVFGLSAVVRAAVCDKDLDAVCETAEAYLGDSLDRVRSFKVNSKRADKKFPLTSMELSREVGAYLLDRHPELSVEMKDPDMTVICEIRDNAAYVHADQVPGAGGIPTGTGGKVACMLSGGIDSPVAAWKMARRGCDLVCVHFQSPPYTGERALYKVERLAWQVSRWAGRVCLFEVPFTDCQVNIRDNAPEDYFTVLMRRSMMRITQMIAEREECGAIATGESLGQVASQTMSAIRCTDIVADMPVFRPLIGDDKVEISECARNIGTFDISIEPYEDCCTIFTPKHPRTKPVLGSIEEEEKGIPGLYEMETAAADSSVLKVIHFYDEDFV